MPDFCDRNKIFDWLWRVPLGLVFIYAAWGKIADPSAFALMIHNYRLFPLWSLGPLAIVLPWVEILAGILVLVGFGKRPASLILGVLLVSFMLAVGFNLYRGLDFNCGCFSGGGGGGREAGFNLLWQDALLLICAVMLTLGLPRFCPKVRGTS